MAHKCQDPTCGNCQFDLSRFCANHKCHSSGCLRKRCSDHHVYCDNHACNFYVFCPKSKDLNGGRMYCLHHNCSKSGCLSPRKEGRKLCEDHGRVN